MPMDITKYAKNWRDLSLQVREAAQQRCEGCRYYPDCRAANGQPHPVTGSKVVLTVAHLDGDTQNNKRKNLRALCQRCHLRLDRAQHNRTRAINVSKREGQMFLMWPLQFWEK